VGTKNDNVVNFPETIYMDRYMDSDDKILKQRRIDAWRWKSRLQKLKNRQAILQLKDTKKGLGMSVPESLLAIHNLVRKLEDAKHAGIDVPPALSDELERRCAQVDAELNKVNQEISELQKKLLEQFTAFTKYEYKLHTVFVHRGGFGGGHYYVNIYDFENEVWRKYNDEHVTLVTDRDRVYRAQNFPDEGTPYYLAYVRSADSKKLVDSVLPVPQVPIDVDVELSDFSDDVLHIEHASPQLRPLAPKPPPGKQFWQS